MRGLSFKHSRMFKCNKIKMTKTVLFIILCIFVHFAIITFIVYKEGGDSNQQRNDLLHKPHVPDKLAVNMHQSRMAEQKISQRKNVKIADDVEIEDNGNDDADAKDEEEKTTSRTGDYDYIIGEVLYYNYTFYIINKSLEGDRVGACCRCDGVDSIGLRYCE